MISVLLHVNFAGRTSQRDEARSKCVECVVSSVLGLARCTVTVDFSRWLYYTSNYYIEFLYIYFNKSCTNTENRKVQIWGYTASTHSATDVAPGTGCTRPVYRHRCIESTQLDLLMIYGQDIAHTQPISPNHFYPTTPLGLYWHSLNTPPPAISPGRLRILCPQ